MEITLEGKAVSLAEPTFGKIKKVVSVYNRLNRALANSSSPMDDEIINCTTELLSIALDKPVERLDEMNISFNEMVQATPRIAELCGISLGKVTPNQPGERTGVDGMNSTSTS